MRRYGTGTGHKYARQHSLITLVRNPFSPSITNGQIKLSLCSVNYELRHKCMCQNGGTAPPFLTLELDGDEWSSSRSCRFTQRERAPGTHWEVGRFGPRFGLDAEGKRKILR